MAPWLLVLALPAGAEAHGGCYRAPGGAGTASTGPARPSAAPAGATGSAGTGTRGTAGRTRAPSSRDVTGWQAWWEHNKHALLFERQRDHDVAASTPGRRQLSGRGRANAPDDRRPDRALVPLEVLPALRGLLATEDDADILDSAVLALARSAEEPDAQAVLGLATTLLKSRVASVQSSAALSLGVLDSPLALPSLRALLADDRTGHLLTGARGAVPDLVRAFAALSLGLLNDPDSVAVLAHLIERLPDRDDDVKACAIVALGLMDNEASDEAARVLLALLDDPALDTLLKAQVPTALARLASRPDAYDPTVLPALLAAFRSKDADEALRQSLALALGRVGEVTAATADGDPTVTALIAAATRDTDLATRQFSVMSLARIVARDGAAGEHAGVHAALLELLGAGLTDRSQPSLRCWYALAAAFYADAQPAARTSLLAQLSVVYDEEHDPSVKSACALAFGILEDASHGDRLRQDFLDLTDDEFRGCAGLALGLLGHDAALDELRAACRNPELSSTARIRIAQGLRLLRDPQVTDILVTTLASSSSAPVCAGLAASLGMVGEPSALEPLRALAADQEAVDVTRAFACVALGMLCEKTDLPWNARLTEDCNYLALVPALAQALNIL